ncbi:MAG: hypothetical protein ACFFAN_15935 [Promethearchaeota archaeon]
MNLIFFIKSASVDLSKYTIKDPQGSSGRIDVISRCILSALLRDNCFEENVQIWVFLDKYGTFIFKSDLLNYLTFPKNEIMLTDYFVKLILNKKLENPLNSVIKSEEGIIEFLKKFIKSDYEIFILSETGQNFSKHSEKLNSKKDLLFVIGNQSGAFLESKELLALNLPMLSLGTQSYLASSVIRLIKLHVFSKI